ncbi:hypothetical protein JCM10207_008733 [Rhodosporidiobolus poonsookiae]
MTTSTTLPPPVSTVNGRPASASPSPPLSPPRAHPDRLPSLESPTTADDDEKGRKEPKPYFFPPLWLQRRTACAEWLRKEQVTSVADLGCGSGALLSLLALPSFHHDDFPLTSYPSPPSSPALSSPSPSSLPSTEPAQSLASKLSVLRSIPPDPPTLRELHLQRLVGVDLDPLACRAAAGACRPQEKRGYAAAGGEDEVGNDTRWEDLRVEVWNGGVEVYNEALEGVEAIVLTEVIEHISPSALARLPSLLFTTYKPRLVILTTPNHAFNPFFPPPSSSRSRSPSVSPSSSSSSSSAPNAPFAERHSEPETRAHLHPDPTGLTNRVFRDPTHLREWTASEFRQWAGDVHARYAAQEGYELAFEGVGSLASFYGTVSKEYGRPEVPEHPPAMALHPALEGNEEVRQAREKAGETWATQIAVFRRGGEGAAKGKEAREEDGEGEEERSPRSTRPAPLPFYSGSPASSPSLPSSSNFPSTSSPSTSSSPPARPTLLSSFLLPAHPLSTCPALARASRSRSRDSLPPAQPSAGEVLEALKGLFHAGRPSVEDGKEGGLLTLADLWRLGTGPSSAPSPALRALVGGRVNAIVDALLSPPADEAHEWALERVEPTREERERGRGRTGMDALGVRWTGWEPEEVARGGWGACVDADSAEEDEAGEEEEEEPAPALDASAPEDDVAGWSDAPRGTWGSAAPAPAQVNGGQDGQGAASGSGWGDDAW